MPPWTNRIMSIRAVAVRNPRARPMSALTCEFSTSAVMSASASQVTRSSPAARAHGTAAVTFPCSPQMIRGRPAPRPRVRYRALRPALSRPSRPPSAACRHRSREATGQRAVRLPGNEPSVPDRHAAESWNNQIPEVRGEPQGQGQARKSQPRSSGTSKKSGVNCASTP